MREFVQSIRFKIILGILSLLVGFMVWAALDAGAASAPEMLLNGITAPFARAATIISSFVETNINTLANANRYKRENEELRRAVAELHRQLVEIDELIIDNELLREMLQISEENPDFEWATNTASVRSWNTNDIFGGFTINRGSQDGIGLHDLVLTAAGVVGVIREVAPHYARVSTVLSTETTIGVVAVRGNVDGVLQNDIAYARDGLLRVGYIARDADIREGDIILTRGSTMYPPNQFIGEVVSVHDDPNGMSKYALIQPGEDVFGLTHVLVITGFNGRLELDDLNLSLMEAEAEEELQ
ncbi:MAG: rod shape-determining protein MreC [Oscillospiraceae bacterium]|nr:rod shape-determining protein MreC [Oscillospiraceae bacterium]